METLTIGLAIVGLINAVQMQFPKIKGIYAWVLAIVLGGLSSFVPMDHPAVLGGLAALVGSGIYKVGQKAGGE